MTTELSKNLWVLVLRGGVNIPIDEEQYNQIEQMLKSGQEVFKVSGRLITKGAVLFIAPVADMEVAERKSRGMWQCSVGHWQPKGNQKCAQCYY